MTSKEKIKMKSLQFRTIKQLEKYSKMLELILDYGAEEGGFNVNCKKKRIEKIWWTEKKLERDLKWKKKKKL